VANVISNMSNLLSESGKVG